jgi:hypothetical protein
LRSTSEVMAHLEKCLRQGFEDEPADTPFLCGYEAALTLWKFWLETGFIDSNSTVEEQIIRLRTMIVEDYRAGFLEALAHIGDDFSPVRRELLN